MTMESEDEFDHLTTSLVSDLGTKKSFLKKTQQADKSSSEDEVSIKSESDTEQGMPRSAAAEHAFSNVSIKLEPESQYDTDSNDAGKDALISSYVKALKSRKGSTDASDESSDEEDETSIKSEQEDDVSNKSEPETDSELQQEDSDEDSEGTMESSEIDTTGTKGAKPLNNENAMQLNDEKGKKNPKKRKDKQPGAKNEEELMSLVFGGEVAPEPEKKAKTSIETKDEREKESKLNSKQKKPYAPKMVQIDQPKSSMEKELMSLVFGGKAALVSELANEQLRSENEKNKAPEVRKPGNKSTAAKRSAIWHDSDDDDEEDSSNIRRNKFSREELPEQLTNERRRKQFEQIVGKPKWADLNRERELDSDDEILQTVGHVVKGTASQGLPKGTIELKKLKNLNRETKAEGEITAINFHPTSMVAIMTGKRGLVSIVTVDGVRNEKLHTIWLPKMRVVCSSLSPDGNEAIFGSYRKFYHVYNLISGQSDTLKIPERETWLMRNFRVSRCGKYLASAGKCGEVHLMSAKSKEVLQTIQLRCPCQSLAFTPDSRYLLCHSNDTEVTVFCLNQKRIVNVFQDDGCVNGSCIAVCPNGQFVATGSRQGVVNIYPLDAALSQKQPVPLKTINNLTTYIDSLSFNVTSELLAIASSTVKNAVKLLHVKSATVFRNFPLPMTNMGHITKAEFSPSGGYLALGTKESTVLLFRVKHYPNY